MTHGRPCTGVVRDDVPVGLLLVVAAMAFIGVALAAVSFALQRPMSDMMGGMTGGGNAGGSPGGFEWVVLAASLAFFLAAVVLLQRGRSMSRSAETAWPAAAGIVPLPSTPPPATAPAPPGPSALTELTLMKLLHEDERRVYLEIRDRWSIAPP